MPKLTYQLILGVFFLSFVVASCNNKSKDKETKKDTLMVKPVDPGTVPATPDTLPDTVKMKPVDPGT